jgi:hypothetical protein
MTIKPSMALLVTLATLAGCAEFDAWVDARSRAGEPALQESVNTSTDELYLNTEMSTGIRDLRNVYIAPANLANMQVIQPEGAYTDAEWWVTDAEDSILQTAVVAQLSIALSSGSAFNIVASREQAQIIVNMAVIAIHPNETRSSIAAGGKSGGAITVSIALVDAASGSVLVRLVDTTSSDDVWSFNQVEAGDPAINLIFSAWGKSIRSGLLEAQGRSSEPPFGPTASA